MKICLINDTHAGARGDSLLFNEFFFKFWEGTFFPYLKENNIKQIIHLGDVVDRRKYINYIILNQWRKRFFDVLERENIQMDIIVGNHDVTYKNTNEINAMHELFNKYNNINVYIEPVEKIYDELQITLVPWINSSNYESTLQFLDETKSELVFGHFEISGFEMDRGSICHNGLNKKIFDRFVYNKSSFNEDLKNYPITTDYKNYVEYSKKSYEILNNINHPNLYKIYSDKLFCDSKIKDRCLVHDSNHTFYLDNNHLSYYGNKILSKIHI